MPLPREVSDADDGDVVGDIDAFMAYVETGQAARDYAKCMDRTHCGLGMISGSPLGSYDWRSEHGEGVA